MEAHPKTTTLEEVATALVDAGAFAILYDEELAAHGTLQLTVYPTSELRTVLLSNEEDSTEAAEEVARASQLLQEVDAVTIDDQAHQVWIDIAEHGIDPLGRAPLYLDEQATPPSGKTLDETTVEDGLNAVGASLGSA